MKDQPPTANRFVRRNFSEGGPTIDPVKEMKYSLPASIQF
jgi:hypothetical protein